MGPVLCGRWVQRGLEQEYSAGAWGGRKWSGGGEPVALARSCKDRQAEDVSGETAVPVLGGQEAQRSRLEGVLGEGVGQKRAPEAPPACL